MVLKLNRFIGILFLLCLVSCREPMVFDRFIKGDGPYVFDVDLGDTTACFDFAFYTRVDVSEARDTLPLCLEWKTPSDSLVSETVLLPMEGGKDVFSRQVYALFREDAVPSEAGLWTLSVSVPDTVRMKGMSGLGFVCIKKREDGTR